MGYLEGREGGGGLQAIYPLYVFHVCVCADGGGGRGVEHGITAGGRGLACGLPALQCPRRPKTFSRWWSAICNGKPAHNGQKKGNANEAVRGGSTGESVALSAGAWSHACLQGILWVCPLRAFLEAERTLSNHFRAYILIMERFYALKKTTFTKQERKKRKKTDVQDLYTSEK